MTLDTEEPDNPPVHVVRPSVSVQLSTTTADAATQTYASTSDAAVQWPEDVHYPIAMDHIYAGKDLEKQEEDCLSQDLFLSDDDSSEESQLQYTQSDPEYNVCSSELSQSTQESQASTDAQAKDRLFLVFESQLKQKNIVLNVAP